MAGYSGTPLAKKLGIKPGAAVALVNAPPKSESLLDGLPSEVTLTRDLTSLSEADVILLFAPDSKQLHKYFALCAKKLATNGGLWVGWYKQNSGIPTDLNEGIVRDFGLAAGLVDNKVCAIDDSWSGLRFVIRVKDRPKAR